MIVETMKEYYTFFNKNVYEAPTKHLQFFLFINQ